MGLPRVIPSLLLKNNGLVKTTKFKDPVYVGDPVNAVRIFNEKEVDELLLIDITATIDGRPPRIDYIREIASECFMPLCYGGGVRTMKEMESLFHTGVEKVAVNNAAFESPNLIREASRAFGAQSIVVSIDFKKNLFGKYSVFTHGGSKNRNIDPLRHALNVQEAGAGEILLNSIDRDGTGSGYELDLYRALCQEVDVPIIACGGAGRMEHFKEAIQAGASAVAAGSFFVFHGKHKAVLITYPSRDEIKALA